MKKKLSLLMIALVALASYAVQQITRASEPETIFSATVIATSDQNFDAGTTEIAATQATITGGKMYAVNNQTSAKKLIGKKTNYYFSMTNNNTYFKVVLDKALAVGDVITADALAGQKTSGDPATNKGIFVSTTEVTNGNFTVKPACQGIDGNEGSDAVIEGLLKYTVTEGDEYVGKTELYIYRAAGATEYFGNFKITREVQEEEPANELTLPGTAIWSSDEAQVVDWNNSKSIQISKEAFANVKAGDVLHVGILDAPEYAANGNWSYQIALQELGSWKNIESGITLQQPGDYVQDYVITGDMLAFMKTYGIAVNGTKFNVKKVTVESKYNGTDESIWLGEETLSGWNNFTVSSTHFYNANNFAGVKAGQIIRVTAKIPAEGSNMTFQYNGTAENDYAWTKYVDDANSFATPTGYEMVVTEDMVEYLNGRGLILCADGGIKVTQIELITPAEPESDGIVISPTGGDIYTALAAEIGDQTEYGNITINLTEGAEYTISSSIVAPASITIKGNGATIDASALEAAMITTPAGDLDEWMEGNFTIKDVTIKGLAKSLFVSAGKNYLYNDFLIDNSVIEFNETAGFEFDFRKGGVAKNFMINTSTLYAPTATTNSLYTSQSAQKGTDAPGVTYQMFSITNSTLYNFAKGKNFFTHRQSNQKWLVYNINNSIFVDCGKSGQVVKGINQGQSGANPIWSIDGNIFNFGGADTSADESTGDEDEPVKNSIEGVITFTSVETPDFGGKFVLAEGATAPETMPGDPRWTINPIDITALKAEIETAKELLSEDADVTVDPEKTLNNAITAAETALETAESQEAVDKAVETLKAAEAKYQALTSDVPEFTPAITVNAIDGDDLYEKLEEAYDGMGRNPATIDIIIPDGATVTVSQTLETKNAIRIYSNGTGTIDASSLSGPMVKAIGIVDDEMPLKALDVNNNFCGNFISWVEFKNLNIAGLKTQLFYANKKAYFIPSVLVDNCVIEIKDASKKTLIDFNGGGVVETLTVQNSTIYGSTGNTWQNGAFFSSQSGKNITDAGSNKIQSFILKNNTFYNFAYKVTVSSLRSNSQKYLKFDVENNIIVDCGKEGQFIKGLNSGANGNTNPAWYVNNNSFLWTDANGKLTDISSKETTGDQYEDVGNSVGLTNDPAEIEEVFPMLEEYPGNFCLATEFCKQRDAQIGDPRWLADPTGVSTLKATITGDADSYYNLQGQKVSNLKRGGVYIKNGRKVVIK